MCFSVPMMFELIHFDFSRIVLLAEVSAKWIHFDYLSLTSFDFCNSLIAACSQASSNYCSPHIREHSVNTGQPLKVRLQNNRRVFASCSQKLFAALHFFRKGIIIIIPNPDPHN